MSQPGQSEPEPNGVCIHSHAKAGPNLVGFLCRSQAKAGPNLIGFVNIFAARPKRART
jgi:hypothetical protein